MAALVVYESMWGNTAAVAHAVAEGLGGDTVVTDVCEATNELPADVRLVVLGGPTHAFSMSRPSTRADAVRQGADATDAERGLREWLATLAPADREVATFDTRVSQVRHLPGSAAKRAAREVRHHHLGRVVDTQSFFVEDVAGPLLDGELERARGWGARLAAIAAAAPNP